jgi:hypothetical protein
MKLVVLLICAIAYLSACKGNEDKLTALANDTTNYTAVHWIDSVKNIGTVAAGTTSEIRFRFKNTGLKPLYIIAARPGCGCTVADYPKEAIAANAEGEIKAKYNVTKGMLGGFRKNITVITNTKGTTNHNIFFYGEIKKS